jgi:IMP dehydrogenase/GMP reductase
MDTVTESAMANFIGGKGGIGVLHRFMSVDRNVEEFKRCTAKVFVSIGTSEEELKRAEALRDAGADYFVVDVAHGHARYVGKTLKRLRELLPNACLMAGNVATYAGADYLASVGADIVKVGIGPGSVCTTRIKTGHGVPQLTAIQDCARCDRSIVADGGIRYPGDVVKALAFGADFVMIGGMLAGTRPTPGERVADGEGGEDLPRHGQPRGGRRSPRRHRRVEDGRGDLHHRPLPRGRGPDHRRPGGRAPLRPHLRREPDREGAAAQAQLHGHHAERLARVAAPQGDAVAPMRNPGPARAGPGLQVKRTAA